VKVANGRAAVLNNQRTDSLLTTRYRPRRNKAKYKDTNDTALSKVAMTESKPAKLNPEPESTGTYFKSLIVWINKLIKHKRFIETRKRIKNGDNLYDLSSDEIGSLKTMGPWTFNIYESVLAVVPAHLFLKVMDFFFRLSVNTENRVVGNDPYSLALGTEKAKLLPSVEAFFTPFYWPVILLAITCGAKLIFVVAALFIFLEYLAVHYLAVIRVWARGF
jgi:hypothetical protein